MLLKMIWPWTMYARMVTLLVSWQLPEHETPNGVFQGPKRHFRTDANPYAKRIKQQNTTQTSIWVIVNHKEKLVQIPEVCMYVCDVSPTQQLSLAHSDSAWSCQPSLKGRRMMFLFCSS